MGARELSLEAARGDGVAVLQLTQGAQASGAQDLDATRVVLAADAVDGHAPFGLAAAGGVRLVVTVVALAELASAIVETGELNEGSLDVGDRRLLRFHHLPMFPGVRGCAQHGSAGTTPRYSRAPPCTIQHESRANGQNTPRTGPFDALMLNCERTACAPIARAAGQTCTTCGGGGGASWRCGTPCASRCRRSMRLSSSAAASAASVRLSTRCEGT